MLADGSWSALEPLYQSAKNWQLSLNSWPLSPPSVCVKIVCLLRLELGAGVIIPYLAVEIKYLQIPVGSKRGGLARSVSK